MDFNVIKEIISSPGGSFASVFSFLSLIFWLIYFVTKNITKFNTEKGIINNSIGKMETNIDSIRSDLSYLKGTIDIIKSNSNPLAKSNSPVSLTELGLKVAEDLKAEDLIAHNWEKIIKTLDTEISDKNAYDIQEYCKQTAAVQLEKFLNADDINKIKEYAYKQGNNLYYYSIIFALLIRDKYFKYKGINLDDIDKHSPNAN